MKILLAALALTISMSSYAQTYKASKNENGELIYNGTVTFSDLQQEKAFNWMDAAAGYTPDAASVSYLHINLPSYDMVVLMGTWCSDSHALLPKLHKVLQASGYPMEQLTMYGVDRDKKTTGGEQEKYKVTMVPTIIVLKSGKEIGRITEAPKKTIEADLADIVRADQ